MLLVLLTLILSSTANAIEVVLPAYTYENPIQACLENAAEKFNVPLSLLYRIARVESDFNPYALHPNRDGTLDVGLLQINSRNIKRFGYTVKEVYENPCLGIELGARYLRECIDRYGLNKKGIGCYHSRTPSLSRKYASKILAGSE